MFHGQSQPSLATARREAGGSAGLECVQRVCEMVHDLAKACTNTTSPLRSKTGPVKTTIACSGWHNFELERAWILPGSDCTSDENSFFLLAESSQPSKVMKLDTNQENRTNMME